MYTILFRLKFYDTIKRKIIKHIGVITVFCYPFPTAHSTYFLVLHLLLAVSHIHTHIYNINKNKPIKSGELRHGPKVKEMRILKKNYYHNYVIILIYFVVVYTSSFHYIYKYPYSISYTLKSCFVSLFVLISYSPVV